MEVEDEGIGSSRASNGPMAGDGSGSALIFLGTGCSSSVPNATCLIRPSDPPCRVCSQSLLLPPDANPNYRFDFVRFLASVDSIAPFAGFTVARALLR